MRGMDSVDLTGESRTIRKIIQSWEMTDTRWLDLLLKEDALGRATDVGSRISTTYSIINSPYKTYSTFSSYLQRIRFNSFWNQGTIPFAFQENTETLQGSRFLNFNVYGLLRENKGKRAKCKKDLESFNPGKRGYRSLESIQGRSWTSGCH